jgi:hypothetical protein
MASQADFQLFHYYYENKANSASQLKLQLGLGNRKMLLSHLQTDFELLFF